MYMIFNFCQKSVLNITQCTFKRQSIILEWFPKDDTEDWSNDAENDASGIYYIFKQSLIYNITVFTVFLIK